MKVLYNIIAILFVFLFYSCSEQNKKILIYGNIPNLPDGTLYLYKNYYSDRIDSIKTKNGEFKLKHYFSNDEEPLYLGIDHKDNNGVTRAFNFPTNTKYRGGELNTQYFMNDSLIKINGIIKNFNAKDIKLSSKYILVISPRIESGKQTEAFYNIDGDLFEKIDENTIKVISKKIAQYPYSYHLLYQIEKNKNSFTTSQIDVFLKSFKGEITQSKTYKTLLAYYEKRLINKTIVLPQLTDDKGKRLNILDSKYDKHFVIFWASWCAPCRDEIPLLKKMYSKIDPSLEFVSVSIDSDVNKWHKALKEENMEWKQLHISEKNSPREYEDIQMYFKFNGAIPYTVLVDNNNNNKILRSFLGLTTEKELEKLILKN
ncbi:AhpC/TSA family protein [Elizabethkingia miricola]|uniref:TlpA disulfide reductase family protein n=1 Tax=Elizabethkingia TaxID=308865 RepID=UPI0020187FA0|nr:MULTISPECIES: TlpA disulfide reductase family protein [Elizabethkingia]MCL1658400.1 AhpC/TSA family protein [Elizabethkingia miricola]MCP1252668.1 AhpC/TSA family protein [Elizabethkingia sp. S0634]